MTGNELIVDYLTSVPAWYLATVEDTPEGAQPHVRPFSFAALQDGEIQFCTATTKDCYREMQAIPRVELTAWKPGRGWIILRGRANLRPGFLPWRIATSRSACDSIGDLFKIQAIKCAHNDKVSPYDTVLSHLRNL